MTRCPRAICEDRLMTNVARFADWPEGADVAVALTFDVDGEAPWLGEGTEYERRLSMLSIGRFGPERGVWRGLELLREHHAPATFHRPRHPAHHWPYPVPQTCAARPQWAPPGDIAPRAHRPDRH